jgi:hypothetical protein
MIPICDKITLTVKDGKGREIKLKYLTELDKQVRYLELSDREDAAITAEMDNLKNIEDEKERRIAAWLKIQNDRRKNIRAYLEEIDEYINIFVIGDNPAASLRLYEKFPLYRIIQENIGVLTGLTEDEIKNS